MLFTPGTVQQLTEKGGRSRCAVLRNDAQILWREVGMYQGHKTAPVEVPRSLWEAFAANPVVLEAFLVSPGSNLPS